MPCPEEAWAGFASWKIQLLANKALTTHSTSTSTSTSPWLPRGPKRLHKLILLVGRRDADAGWPAIRRNYGKCFVFSEWQLANRLAFPLPQVTLHSNMQKVIELSQSVLVDKSVIERFEEIQRQSKQAPGTAASTTSIMMATEMEMATATATAEFGSSTTTTRTTTTKSISMSTFETQKTLRATLSSSSSNSSSGSHPGQQQHSETDEAETETEARQRSLATERQSLETLLLQHKQQLLQHQGQQKEKEKEEDQELEQQLQGVLASDAGEEAATATPFGNNQSDNNSQRNKQNNILKQQITLSLDLSDPEDDGNHSPVRDRQQPPAARTHR